MMLATPLGRRVTKKAQEDEGYLVLRITKQETDEEGLMSA